MLADGAAMNLGLVEAQFNYIYFLIQVLLWRSRGMKFVYRNSGEVHQFLKAQILLRNKTTRIVDFVV